MDCTSWVEDTEREISFNIWGFADNSVYGLWFVNQFLNFLTPFSITCSYLLMCRNLHCPCLGGKDGSKSEESRCAMKKFSGCFRRSLYFQKVKIVSSLELDNDDGVL